MKLKNKIFLSLGTTVAVIAPITTAVACGDTKEVSQTAIEQRELWAKSQNLIETKYQEMLISEISKNKNHQIFGPDIKQGDLQDYSKLNQQMKDAILAVVKRNIYITPTYLTTFAEKLLHTANPDAHKYQTIADYKSAVESILKTSVGNFNGIIDSITKSNIDQINKIAEALGKGTMPTTNDTMPVALTATADKAAIDKFIADIKAIFHTNQKLAANKNSMSIDTTAKLDAEFAKYKYGSLPAELADTAAKSDIDQFITALEGVFSDDQQVLDNLSTLGIIKTKDELDKHLTQLKDDAVTAVNAFKDSLYETKTTSIAKLDKWDDIDTTITALIALVANDTDAQSIAKSDVPFTFSELTNDGFYDYYLQNTDVTKDKATNDKVEALVAKYIPIIWKDNIASFKNVFYQYVISSLYLDTNKTNWQAVFYDIANATGKINGLEGNLKADHFVLGQKLLRNKLAYDWNITLDDQASKAYAGIEKTETDLDAWLKVNGDIYNDATTTQRRSLLPSFAWDNTATTGTVWDLVNQSKELIGFNGLVEKSEFASTDSKIKQVVDTKQYDVNYEGYVNKEKTGEVIDESSAVNNIIKLTTPSNSKVDVEKIIMLMPTYVNGELSLDFLKDAKGGDGFATLRDILISKQGSDIYKEAIEYYSSKDNKEFTYDNGNVKGIRLTILDESLRKVATDTFGLGYVNKD